MTLRVAFRSREDLPPAVAAVRDGLADHGLVVFPTETFYGLGVDPRDEIGVSRVFAAKGRDTEKALPIVVASFEAVSEFAVVPDRWRDWLRTVWPAPLTVVLPLRRKLPACDRTVAVRVPDHALLRELLTHVGALTATSANRAGAPPPSSVDDALADLGPVDIILDGGATAGGLPSTLIDACSDDLLLLRAGAWTPPPDLSVKAP